MNVNELILRLAQCDGENEVRIDPPNSSVIGLHERRYEDVVELRH